MSLQDKVALVTGGNRGIGFAITKAYVEQGAKVVINYNSDEQQAQSALNELNQLSKNVVAIQANVSISEDRQRLIDETVKHFGRIDILVNNAGIGDWQTFMDSSEEDFDRVLNCNLKGAVFLAKLAAQQMIKQGDGGSIVNLSSIAGGHRPFDMHLTTYSISKAGLSMATKALAVELGPHKIRVNSISPGDIETDINRDRWEGDPKAWSEKVSKYPLQRSAKPEEIAGAAVYLASDSASYTTGADIVVDGEVFVIVPICPGCFLAENEPVYMKSEFL